MNNATVAKSFLVFSALSEDGDMTVIDQEGDHVRFEDFKSMTPGIKLAFPSTEITRSTFGLQLWWYSRFESHLIICRSMISGGSRLTFEKKFRPLPLFEVFLIRGCSPATCSQVDFLDMIKGLRIEGYPSIPADGTEGFVERPQTWFVPDALSFESRINKKPKEVRKAAFITDWLEEARRCLDKMLWYAWRSSDIRSGTTMCFTSEDFRRFGTCTYYYGDYKWREIIAYQFSPDFRR